MNQKIARHKGSYRIGTGQGEPCGVLVRYEINGVETHVLICPETISEYPGEEPDFGVCSSALCKYDEIHEGANEVLVLLRRTPKNEGRIAELEKALAEIADAEIMPSSARGVAIRALRGES